MISPTVFLAALVVGTAALFIGQILVRRVHQHRLMNLAREWRMHYAPDDRFSLAARVAERLPVPGAADVRVVDLIYGMDEGTRRYVFSAHYTRGVVRWKRRGMCVASLSEIPDRMGGNWSPLHVAPMNEGIVEQYRKANEETGFVNQPDPS